MSAIYDPAVALEFFKSAGKPEEVAPGTTLFAENEKKAGFFSDGDKMYLLLDGEIGLVAKNKEIETVGKGEIFGEMASMSQLPRSATAVAKTRCRLMSLDGKQFQKAIQQTPQFALMLMNIVIGRLRQTIARLGSGVALTEPGATDATRVFDRKLLAELEREMEGHPPVRFLRRSVIMNEGDTGVFMYVVLEGQVAISLQSKFLEAVGPGGVFGEMALVDRSPRSATATATTDCSLLAINRNGFLELLKAKPAFGVSLLRALAERLRFMTSQLK